MALGVEPVTQSLYHIPDIWKAIIKRHLGRNVANKYRLIAKDILLVDGAIKSGFLFDYSSVTVNKISELLSELNQEKLLIAFSDLKIVEIESDILIYNVKVCSQFKWSRIQFIDISEKNSCSILDPEAVSLKPTKDIFEKIRNDDLSNKFCKFSVEDTLMNPTTLFGIIIGYPAVYWYDISKDNALLLSMVPLQCVQIFQHNHVVYSFSVPSSLWSDVKDVVQSWFSEKQTLCEQLRMETNVRCFPSVAL